MTGVDVLGYAAALLVLATFCVRSMVWLRMLAIASNVAFISYAVLAQIHPVLALHALLLPMNAWRLAEALQQRRTCGSTPAARTFNPGESS
jgi:CRP/FNR family transcriptional regulator, cyclic AMP receptor protein